MLAYGVAGWLLLVGLYGVVSSRHLVHLILSLGVLQASTYVLLLAIGFRTGARAPIFADIPVGSRVVDPLVQALCLTDVVVEATVSALLLGLALQAHKRFGTVNPNEIAPQRG
ncbi:MAG TPA: NADH-quinone oxidoreductase subunit K [Solirubrobacteraceae bacterium]|nr:NADH-quinone oxidoreductase subunit K [Solirubrobacteraceae bacterium]